MKIAQVVNTFPPVHGGMGIVCFYYARELAALGHEVTVFTVDYGLPSGHEDPASVRVERLQPVARYGDGAWLPQLASRLRAFDVTHLHYPFYGGAEFVCSAAGRCGIPYLLTYHMDSYGNNRLKKGLIFLYEAVLLRRLFARAAAVTSPGVAYLRTTKAARRVQWEKVADLRHAGVDTDRFRPRPKDPSLVAQHDLAGKTVVLFVGNPQPFKGLHLLIDAVAGLADKTVVLLVVGGGYGERRYRKQALARGAGRRVIFAGAQSPDRDLPAYYNLADLLVLPSTHSESYGLVVLEAMASGKPAIVSALPGPAQLVRDGTDGAIVRVNDADHLRQKLEQFAADPALRARMGDAARRKVLAEYTWPHIGRQLEQVLARIAGSGGHAS